MTSTLLPDPAVEPAAEESKEKQESKPRPYTVLRRMVGTSPGTPPTFDIVRDVHPAHSADQAVREVATMLFAAGEEAPITLVAVTAARFKLRTINAKPRDPQLILS